MPETATTNREELLRDVLTRLEGKARKSFKQSGEWFNGCCSAHGDEHASLGVRMGDKRIIFKCLAGCSEEAVASGIGRKLSDLYYAHKEHKTHRQPLTLEALAQAKGFTVDYLRSLGCYQDNGALMIPYLLADGSRAPRTRRRTALKAKDGSTWTGTAKDGAPVPYGLDRLAGAREAGYLIIVEGETDTWSLRSIHQPALGIPGSSMVGTLAAAHVEGIGRVYIHREPDKAGSAFVRDMVHRLKAVDYAGEVLVIDSGDGIKDPNELMVKTQDEFAAAFKARLEAARPAADVVRELAPVEPDAAVTCDGDALDIRAFNCTDSGNAELFARLYGDRLRFDHRRGRWLLWERNWWKSDADGELHRLAKLAVRERYRLAWDLEDAARRERQAKFSIRSEDRTRLVAMITLAQNEMPIADAGDGWDADPWTIGVANGVVDLRLGTLRAGKPEDKITRHIPIDFDRAAPCPIFKNTAAAVFSCDLDLIDYFWRSLGYTITGDFSEQVWFALYGEGRNGKTTLMESIQRVFGPYWVSTPFSTFLQDSRGGIPCDLAALDGARLVTASESAEGQRFSSERMKMLSGGDTITARHLYQELYSFQFAGKLWLRTNHRPKVNDDSPAFWRRVRLLPFIAKFEGANDDKRLAEKLAGEAPGILAWVIAGAVEWQKRGLEPPAAVRDAVDEYRLENDPLAGFLRDECLQGPKLWATSGSLYAAYSRWAESEHLAKRDVLSSTAFGLRMAHLFKREHTRSGARYIGVGLRAES